MNTNIITFGFKMEFQTLLGPCYAVLDGPLFHSVMGVPMVKFSRHILADWMFWQVFIGLPTGAILSFANLVHTFIQSASSFLSTCPCHLSLRHLITSPIASTPRRLLSSVLGFLSFRETPHIHLVILISVRETPPIHLVILISVLSIYDSSSAVQAHDSHPYNKQLLMHVM